MSMIHEMIPLTKGQLDLLLSRPETAVDFLDRPEERSDECSLYKYWHCMHFLLNAEPWTGEPPLCWAVLGALDLGADMGYGPAHCLLPEQVRAVAEALRELPPDELFADYDPVAMREAELYHAPREGDEGHAERTLRKHYEQLRDFYARAARAGHGALTWLQ